MSTLQIPELNTNRFHALPEEYAGFYFGDAYSNHYLRGEADIEVTEHTSHIRSFLSNKRVAVHRRFYEAGITLISVLGSDHLSIWTPNALAQYMIQHRPAYTPDLIKQLLKHPDKEMRELGIKIMGQPLVGGVEADV